MDTMLAVLSLFVIYGATPGESVVCYNQPDGVYEVNCRAYTLCVDGEERIVNCEPGLAFNKDSKQCENKWDVPPPCGTYRDCADREDGYYPDLETKCGSYYVCSNGVFSGHTLCPEGLVYNIYQGVCDYIYSAPPPCGTNISSVVTSSTLGAIITGEGRR